MASTTGGRGTLDLAKLIQAASAGEPGAIDNLCAVLYVDLRRIAHAKLRREGSGSMLDTTSLVHESYLRLLKLTHLEVSDRAHFLAYAGRVMRSVVVDLLRESRAERRGGGLTIVTFDTAADHARPVGEDEALAIHEALAELAHIDERLVRVVEMRYFGGLAMDEIAEALSVGKRTVERDWEKARSFLFAAMQRHHDAP